MAEATKKYHKHNRYDRGHTDRVTLTERDLDYLQFIFETGPVRSSIIHLYFSTASGKHAKQNTTRRLASLYHHPNCYLNKPEGQQEREGANYVDLRFTLSGKGVKALLDNGRISEKHFEWYHRLHGRGISKPFWHDALGADYLGSLRLGIKADPTLHYLSKYEVLERAPESTQKAKNPLAITLPDSGKLLVPDDIFGVSRTLTDGTTLYRYHPREDDAKSEPNRRVSSTGSSYYEKLPKYKEALESGALKQHFGIKNAPVVIVTITLSNGKCTNMVKMVRKMDGPWRDHLAFISEPSFSRRERPAPPDARILLSPYKRAAAPDFYINAI